MKIDIFDVVSIIGILFFAFGTWLISPAICFVFTGILLLIVGLLGAKLAAKRGVKEVK